MSIAFVHGGTELFIGTPRTGRSRLGLVGSAAGHALLVVALFLVPLLRPVVLPHDRRDYVRVLLYDPPPPPPPPLPKGSSLLPPARRSSPTAPSPRPSSRPRLAAPLELPRLADVPAPEDLGSGSEVWGSETGSDSGVPEGMEGGVEGGVVGGVPGGVLGGVIGGTGTVPVVERNYDRPARAIRITKPVYPHEAFVKKAEGTVIVEIVIGTDGRVARARIVRSVPLLDEAALETVGQWLFAPAIKRGKPVATMAQAPITFRIY